MSVENAEGIRIACLLTDKYNVVVPMRYASCICIHTEWAPTARP